MSKIKNEKMSTENPKIVNFYKEHPNIDFEKSNLLLLNSWTECSTMLLIV